MQELQPTGFESDYIAFFSYFTNALGIKKQKILVHVSFFFISPKCFILQWIPYYRPTLVKQKATGPI